MSWRNSKWLPAIFILVSACSTPVDRPANFGIVDPPSDAGAARYRGAHPTAREVALLQHELRIRTMIRLSRGEPGPDRAAAEAAGVRLLEFPIDPEKVGTSDEGTTNAVEGALAAFADPQNAPVYIYCDYGRDRTGYVVALYRLRAQGWRIDQVEREMELYGHGWFKRWYMPNLTQQLRREASLRKSSL